MSQAAKRDSVVIIPTYNEKENIANIIGVVLSLPHEFDVLIIDDNSPDGTAAIVKGLIKENPGINAPSLTSLLSEKDPAVTLFRVKNEIGRNLERYIEHVGSNKTGGYYLKKF